MSDAVVLRFDPVALARVGRAFAEMREALLGAAPQIRAAFAALRLWLPPVPLERPVDRARRLYVARVMRVRARRARRHGRVLR